ncbi:type II toxin-antitoxin system prevent-host-death family antitoxin [Sandaracinobacter sp. RS1-74]|uniref:type II toxin-antitoxin system Phd/YefM family antitoxin n=1 Tax=Sandaracinobacteroides sayramensis TaxID=2913411 RepID=UPI001EDB1E0F|nr:type II toxin-antitoxin system prevent-host-death family antitoxin [Sandaracinobacteroides sayramensis]MCG2842250.1 type II toxin-antitoxin system prevent-host-death family antitoxin [Sandaracinobacteroides sayramensis]
MMVTTVSSRDFNSDVGGAKKAAAHGPVFITDRGKPAHVLLSIEEYKRLRGVRKMSLLESLTPSRGADEMDDEFEFPKLGSITRLPDFD